MVYFCSSVALGEEPMFGINNLHSHEIHVASTNVSLVPNRYLALWTFFEVWDWKLLSYGTSINQQHSLRKITSFFFFFFFFFFCLFAVSWATLTAYGGSRARSLIGAAAAGLCQSHSNLRSKPHL